uniref:Uncharacterized protein n=1 Tax=Kryptolebias marmoratus TaxID=37003 RepID=A0A3Q3AY01_KRYMA
MPSSSFTLDAQLRFHDKWLKIDLQRAFSPEGLSEMWNEMVKDEEITFNGEESSTLAAPTGFRRFSISQELLIKCID